jgi:hypothetical protein
MQRKTNEYYKGKKGRSPLSLAQIETGQLFFLTGKLPPFFYHCSPCCSLLATFFHSSSSILLLILFVFAYKTNFNFSAETSITLAIEFFSELLRYFILWLLKTMQIISVMTKKEIISLSYCHSPPYTTPCHS